MTKHSFTLLEICIALLILTIVGGFLAWPIKDALDHHRFRAKVKQVKNQLQKLQILAMSYQIDLSMTLRKEEGHLFFFGECDQAIKISKLHSKTKLDEIAFLTFNKMRLDEGFVLHVSPTGRIEPLGILGFYRKEINLLEQEPRETEALWIDLLHPLQVKMTTQIPEKSQDPLPSYPVKKRM